MDSDITLTIPGAPEEDFEATLGLLFPGGLGEFARHPHDRQAFLHRVMSMICDLTTEEDRLSAEHFIYPLDAQLKRLRILELLHQHLDTQIEFESSSQTRRGDLIIPVSHSHATLAPGGACPPGIVSHVKRLVHRLEFHCLAAQTCSPRRDIHTFVKFAGTDISISAWTDVARRLCNWFWLGSGQSVASLVDQRHDPAAVFAAAKAAQGCYAHVVAAADLILELTVYGDSFIYVQPRIPSYVLSNAILDFVLYVFGDPMESAAAMGRIPVYRTWLEQVSLRSSWPCFGHYLLEFNDFNAQALVFRVSWLSASAPSPLN